MLRLPRKMGECLVGLGHFVHVLALPHCVAFVLGGEHEFFGEFFVHRFALLALRGFV